MDFANHSIGTIVKTPPTSRVDNLKKICDTLKIDCGLECTKANLQELIVASVHGNDELKAKVRDIASKIHEANKKLKDDGPMTSKNGNGDDAITIVKGQSVDMLKYICKVLSLEEKGTRTAIVGRCLKYIDNNKSGLETVREIIANRTLTATKANKTTPSSQTATKMTDADANVSTLDQTPAPQVDREHTTPEMAPNQTDGSVKHDYEVKGKEPVPEPVPSLMTLTANAVKGATCGAITYKAPPTTNLEADMSGVMDGEMDTSSSQTDLFDITGDISMTTKLSQHEHINTHAISPSQGTHNTSSEQTNSKPKNHSTATTHNEQPGPNFDMDDDNEDIFRPWGTTQQPHEEHPGPSVNMVEVDENSFTLWELTQQVSGKSMQISEAAERMGEAFSDLTKQFKECLKDLLEKESDERRKDKAEAENQRRVEAEEQRKRYEEKLTKERAEYEEQRRKDKTEYEERLRNEKAEHEEQRRKD